MLEAANFYGCERTADEIRLPLYAVRMVQASQIVS
jgi:hypothetical protein